MKTLIVILAITLAFTPSVLAHCDTLDGPVVSAARNALQATNINAVLIWVQKTDEPEIKRAFAQTLDVRTLSPAARDLADRYFFETVVRVHRAGEGASFTGLKPAGEVEPGIALADKAIQAGSVDELARHLTGTVEAGLRAKFKEVAGRRNFQRHDVDAGREYVHAYVEFIHYVEGLFEKAGPAPQNHQSHGKVTDAHGASVHAH